MAMKFSIPVGSMRKREFHFKNGLRETTRAPDFLNAPKVGRIKADSYDRYNGRDDL